MTNKELIMEKNLFCASSLISLLLSDRVFAGNRCVDHISKLVKNSSLRKPHDVIGDDFPKEYQSVFGYTSAHLIYCVSPLWVCVTRPVSILPISESLVLVNG